MQYFVILVAATLVTAIASALTVVDGFVSVLAFLTFIPTIWISFCVGARRLHDVGLSGWWLLVSFIPLVNIALGVYMLFKAGHPHVNQYGPPSLEHMVRADASKQTSVPTSAQFINRSKKNESATQAIPQAGPLSKDYSMPPAVAAGPNDETLWANSLAEFESDKRRQGLWAKSFADSKGNESLAKATYLASRVKELQSERQATLHQQEEARQQVQDQQKLDAMAETERRNYLMPKGQCPNCQAVIPLSSTACPKCKAMFGPDSSWRLQPVKIGVGGQIP